MKIYILSISYFKILGKRDIRWGGTLSGTTYKNNRVFYRLFRARDEIWGSDGTGARKDPTRWSGG